MKTSILAIVIGFVALVLSFSTLLEKKPSFLGSATLSESNYSTTTSNSWNTDAATTGGFRLLKTGSGQLGSVIVTNESAGSFTLYDATTTVNGAIYGTTTLAKVYASQAEGTYTYDTFFRYGLIAEFQSSNVASSTVTWK